jgi:hypothetical protein
MSELVCLTGDFSIRKTDVTDLFTTAVPERYKICPSRTNFTRGLRGAGNAVD